MTLVLEVDCGIDCVGRGEGRLEGMLGVVVEVELVSSGGGCVIWGEAGVEALAG